MEVLIAVAVFVLAAGGLGLGLALGRAAPGGCCGGTTCGVRSRCATCPKARAAAKGRHDARR